MPTALDQVRAEGWHWVIEGGVLSVGRAATEAANATAAPAAMEAILTILKLENVGVKMWERCRGK